MDYLNKTIIDITERTSISVVTKKTSKRKTNYRKNIRSNLNNNQLSNGLNYGKTLGFFSVNTNEANFLKAFNGRFDGTKINWTSTVYSLRCFINRFIEINKRKETDKKILTHGKWDVIADIFTVKNRTITPRQLRNASSGNKEKTEDLDRLIEEFKDDPESDD